MRLKLEQLGIETTIEKFIEDWGNIDKLEYIKKEIESIESDEYYEDDDYYIEKRLEDNELVVTFTGNGNGFLDLYFKIDKKYKSKVMYFLETRYTGYDENGKYITYIEWENEYNPKFSKLDIPSLLFKQSGSDNFILVCTNIRKSKLINEKRESKEIWINKKEEDTFNKLEINEDIQLNGKYTIKEIISLDDLNEDNWYHKLKSISRVEEDLPEIL